jgi:hypothetical protein
MQYFIAGSFSVGIGLVARGWCNVGIVIY